MSSSKRLVAALQQMDGQVFGYIEDTDRGGAAISAKRDAPLVYLNLAVRGWSLKCQIDDLKYDLDIINDKLLTGIGVGHAVVVEGVTRATLVERNTVNIESPVHLRAVLADRFADLVKIEVNYKPEPKLIALACDGNDELAKDIRECLTVKTTQSVTWRPNK